MRLPHLIAATLVLAAAGCTKNFNDAIACASDLNCPSGYHCGSNGKCQTGEASVTIAWLSPVAGAAVGPGRTFSVNVSHPDGVKGARLLAGTKVLSSFTAEVGGFGSTAPQQVDFKNVDTTQIPEGNATLSVDATSAKGQTGNTTRAFLIDNSEATPVFAVSSIFSGNTSGNPLLVGTASTGPSASTVALYPTPDCSGVPVATGSASAFAAGIPVSLVQNAATQYTALSTDLAGNVSACSTPVTVTNAQSCLDGAITSAQVFSPKLQGCGGKVTFPNRATLCAPGCRPATSEEWVANSGGAAPNHHYWTDDVLAWSNFSTQPCGPAGCATNNCFASRGANSTVLTACIANQPMRVCAGTGAQDFADPDGNTCTWTACGYNSIAPKQFFGGCSGTNDATAGTLCVCGIRHLYVNAGSGNDGNAGTAPGSPLKTITKALSLAQAGETIFVAPGTYDTANGETFPMTVPADLIVIGDEPNRGAAGTPTRIVGPASGIPVVVNAGATLAGFSVGGAASSVPVVKLGGANATVRNNTISSAGSFGLEVSGASGYQALMNTITGNFIGFLARTTVTSGKVESNASTANAYGLDFEILGGDPGGGAAGSVGNNTLSCNTTTDLWTNSTGFSATGNRWDHNPVTSGTVQTSCPAGVDICVNNVVVPATTGAVQTAPNCP